MAKLAANFRPEIAQLMQGHIDLYYWKGIPVARSWPRKPLGALNPNVQVTANNFGDNLKAYADLPGPLRDQLLEQTAGTDWTGRDLYMNALYGHHTIVE